MPLNPERIVREARCYEKAKALLSNPIYELLEDPNFDGLFTIYKQGAPVYAVNTLDRTCSCPDFAEKGHVCKHLLACDLVLDNAALEAQADVLDSAECATGTDPHYWLDR